MNFGSFVAGTIFGGLAVLAVQDVVERRERLKKHFDDAIDDNIHYGSYCDDDADIQRCKSKAGMPSFDEFMNSMKADADAKREAIKRAAGVNLTGMNKTTQTNGKKDEKEIHPNETNKEAKNPEVKEAKTAPEFI